MKTLIAALPYRPQITKQTLRSANALLGYLALASFAAHMLVAGNYGYFRDELYYMAGGRHLAWGYVDYPPLIAWLAALNHVLFRDALVGLHLFTALANAALIVISGLLARELGGSRFAQFLAALGSAVTLYFMATGSLFTYDVFDELWWALAAYVLVRLIRRNQPRLWLLFGLVAGIGLLTKLTILFFGFALVMGLLLTPHRAMFRTRWPWLGGLSAFACLLPYGLWNAANGWPTWEFWHNYSGLSGGGPLDFFANQIVALNLFDLPLAIAGLIFYFRAPAGKPYRALGWAYVILYVLFTVINAKAYFLAPFYPILYAGGALQLDHVFQRQPRKWLKPAYVATLIASGLYFAPLAMPVLPPAAFARGYGFLTGVGNGGAGQHTGGVFPQYLGDRFGWDTLTATVNRVYRQLPPSEQAQACIFTQNYGEAGALEYLGRADHLPPVISGHNNYYLWGPGHCTGQVVIMVNIAPADAARYFTHVQQVATLTCADCMASEDGAPILVCTGPKAGLQSVWRAVKHYN